MIVVEDVHKHFGGFHAVDGASLKIDAGLDHRADRPERRRKDHAFQRDRGRSSTHLRAA